ncbi:MAG: hypothetical protein WC683_10095 [bacterium]
MTRAALALALLLLAAPCEARTWRFTLTDYAYTGATCEPDSTQLATMAGYVQAFYQSKADSAWRQAGWVAMDTLGARMGSFEWEPTHAGVFRLYAQSVSIDMVASCKRDTTAWIAIDPRIPPPPRWWMPGQP